MQGLLNTHHDDGPATITGMGDYRFGGSWCLERCTPELYDEVFRKLQGWITSPGARMPAMNERSYGWAILALDFDCEKLPFLDHDAEARRIKEFTQLGSLFVQELEMHFTGYVTASCVVVRNDVYRFRLLFPGVVYVSVDSVSLLVRMVRRKCYGTSLYGHLADDVLDMGPTAKMALRVHGTTKDNSLQRRYKLVTTIPDSEGNLAPIDRLSIRPSHLHYDLMLESPDSAYLRARSVVARDTIQGVVKTHKHQWKPTALSAIFDLEPNEDESDSDDLDQDEPTMHLLGRRIIVAEHRGVKALVLLHGERADTATVHYDDGRTTIVDGLEAHQYTEEEMADEPDLLNGPLISLFTEALLPPRISTLLQFPLELFVYRPGFSPLQVGWDEEAERYEFDYQASERRRITLELDTAQMARWALAAVGAEFQGEIDGETRYVNDPSRPYCNQAFNIGHINEQRTLVVQIEADCGAGKTVFALEYIKTLLDRGSKSTVLCVAPRAQLCAQLRTKMQTAFGFPVHYYQDGVWPHDSRACVVTVDSLVKTVAANGVTRYPTIILLDETELTAHHIATSSTLSGQAVDGRLRTLETLQVLLAHSRRVLAMDAHFGFGASLFLAMITVKRAQLGLDSDIKYLHLHHEKQHRLKYIVTQDEASRVVKIREDLLANKNVIVFEPSPKKALALSSLFMEWQPLVVHGHSPAELKEEFARDPNAYLAKHNVRLLIHTSSIGVGVSIDSQRMFMPAGDYGKAHHFDTSYVAYRPFLPDDAIVQGTHRARDLLDTPNGAREVNVLLDKRMRYRYSELLSMPTIGDALMGFEQQLMDNRELFKGFGALAILSRIDARLTIDKRDINTLFIAAMLYSSRLAVNVQGLTLRTRLVDDAVELELERTPAAGALAADVRRAEKAVVLRADITDDDGPHTVSQKERLLKCIGYPFDAGKRSRSFMGRLEYGMSHPSNLRRCTALLVQLLCGDAALRKHVISVLDNETETTPLYQVDDRTGVTVGVETVVASGALSALGFTLPMLTASQVPQRTSDMDAIVGNVDGTLTPFSDLFESVLPQLKGERWASCKRKTKQPEKQVMSFLNCYFGGKVFLVRGGVWDSRQLRLSAELVPNYMQARGLQCPPEVEAYCAAFNGTWDAFIQTEARGVPQSSIY